MENIGLWIYLAGFAGGLKAFLIAVTSILFTYITIYSIIESAEKNTKIMWESIRRPFIILVFTSFFAIVIPSERTCFQILGITIAVNIIQDSEELQQLPNKTFGALNRFLDSIVEEGEKEKR